jgi:hypothetical protein
MQNMSSNRKDALYVKTSQNMHTKSDSMQNLWRIHQGMDVDLASVLEYLRQMEAGV